MREGIDKGYTIPQSLVKKVILQIAGLNQSSVEANLFFIPIKNISTVISDRDKKKITKAYKIAIERSVIPAQQKMLFFLQNEYLPHCRTSSGIAAIPNGKAYYEHLIKKYTTTTKSANEIFATGQDEVKRITKEMEKVKNAVGFKGNLKTFFEYLQVKKEDFSIKIVHWHKNIISFFMILKFLID